MSIEKRVFVSFDEFCPHQCRYCFTYDIPRLRERTIEEIVNSIENDTFDVIYISQKNDNFSNPYKGMELTRQLFRKYKTNVFIITRTVFDKKQLRELDELSKEVNDAGKMMFVAVSINAIDSISICENPDLVAMPMRRISFIKELSTIGLHPILMLRPVFPSEVIPVAECEKLIEATSNDVSCVVSSGLGVNDSILSRLGMKESDFSYKENQEYLQGAIECEIKFVNVEKELAALHKKCTSLGIPMFEHSMPAINYVMNMET